MENQRKKSTLSYCCYRVIRWLIWLFYPKITVEGAEHLPAQPCILVGNHAQMHGPIIAELYMPGERAIWCAGQMMSLKEVPNYAYQDFWSEKPRSVRWMFRLLSYVIAPLSVCIFNNAHTIPVHRDARLLSTFRSTVNALKCGANVVIFPECPKPHNHIVNKFQDRFIDTAKLYYRRTGQIASFVPVYNAVKLKKLCIGTPVPFCPDAPIEQERQRICTELADQITALAAALPQHTVVPYANISPKQYGTNIPPEVTAL